jgi:exo-beta-1,3-glucanase (GH17 family)
LKQSEDDKTWPTSIIAEVGWPSEGGENCGGATGACSGGEEGAVASVDGMNEFMEGWVCESLRNGTAYFW